MKPGFAKDFVQTNVLLWNRNKIF